MLRRRGKEVKKKKLIYNYFLEQDIKSGQFIWLSMKDFSKLLLNKFQKRSQKLFQGQRLAQTGRVCNNNWAGKGVNMAAQEFIKWALRSSFVGCGLNKALRED